MRKKSTRQNFLTYFKRRLASIIDCEERNCFYVSGTESRELLGAINFVWCYDYITDEERKSFINEVYEHLTKAERKIGHSL